MQLTLGRTVHYNSGGTWYSALVVRPEPDLILRVFAPSLQWPTLSPNIGRAVRVNAAGQDTEIRPVGEGTEPGCWRWPPREP